MKKIAYSVLIIFGIILLTGCTKNINFSKTSHIVCTKTENGVDATTNRTLTFSYDKNEKIEDFKVEIDIKYKEEMSEDALNIISKAMKLTSKALKLNFESKVEKYRLYYSFTGNIKYYKELIAKLDEEYNEENIKDATKEEILSKLQKEGYSCKDNKK